MLMFQHTLIHVQYNINDTINNIKINMKYKQVPHIIFNVEQPDNIMK